jgi:hypothetical protein
VGTKLKSEQLSEFHINAIWEYLALKFGFDLAKWKARFEEYRDELRIKRRGIDDNRETHFYHFGNTVINPVLNEILGRRSQHNTFNNMVEYLMTGKNQKKKL